MCIYEICDNETFPKVQKYMLSDYLFLVQNKIVILVFLPLRIHKKKKTQKTEGQNELRDSKTPVKNTNSPLNIFGFPWRHV